MNIEKSENAYYTKDNLLDYLTEDDIAIFACRSKDFENSRVVDVHIMDREKDTIICWVFDENDRKMFLKYNTRNLATFNKSTKYFIEDVYKNCNITSKTIKIKFTNKNLEVI